MSQNINWEKVARALLHPTQIQILDALNEAPAPRSALTLAPQLQEAQQFVEYHLAVLEQASVLQKVGVEQRRGVPAVLYVLAGQDE